MIKPGLSTNRNQLKNNNNNKKTKRLIGFHNRFFHNRKILFFNGDHEHLACSLIQATHTPEDVHLPAFGQKVENLYFVSEMTHSYLIVSNNN